MTNNRGFRHIPFKQKRKKNYNPCVPFLKLGSLILFLVISIPSFIFKLDDTFNIKENWNIIHHAKEFFVDRDDTYSDNDDDYYHHNSNPKMRSGSKLKTTPIWDAEYRDPTEQINHVIENNKIIEGGALLEIHDHVCEEGYVGINCEHRIDEFGFCTNYDECPVFCRKDKDCDNSYAVYLHDVLVLPETLMERDYHVIGKACRAMCIDNECICQGRIEDMIVGKNKKRSKKTH